jgi:hypothetical protein
MGLKQDNQSKNEELQRFLTSEHARKERKRLELTVAYRRMQSHQEATERDQKSRIASLFEGKKEQEKRRKADMETRIRELEVMEQRIIDNLKKTYSYHQDEVQRLERLMISARTAQSPASAAL